MKNIFSHWAVIVRLIKKQNKYFIIEMVLSLLFIVMLLVLIKFTGII
jgi:hypothetical protein